MKAVIVALNSQYVHTALAARVLLAATTEKPEQQDWQVTLWEGTINEDWRRNTADLFALRADLYAFSVYIWNAETVQRIAARLRQVLPESYILYGGPEVSYNATEWLESSAWLDAILAGEAEETFPQFLYWFAQKSNQTQSPESKPNIPGLHMRQVLREASKNIVIQDSAENQQNNSQLSILNSQFPLISDLSTLAFPYTDVEMRATPQRIYYYESSRGCPFSCQYCLSAAQRPVRFRPLEQVFGDLSRFISAGVKQVKFVDRTFNCDRERSLAIWRFLIAAAKDGAPTAFHFELAAELIDDAALQVLREAPAGLFQFEIGVQSTHAPTLTAIQRSNQLASIQQRVRQVQALRGQHLHLDLIAGLPEEDWQACGASFDWVAGLRPEMLQQGFLKMLHGSGLRATAEERGDLFSPHSPYEILRSNKLSHGELLKLQHMAELVDRYFNSGRFRYILQGLERRMGSSFKLFEQMADFWQEQRYTPLAREGAHYQRLAAFAARMGMNEEEINCRLACDFCLWHRDEDLPPPLDAAVRRDTALFRAAREALQPEELHNLFPLLNGLSGKELWRRIRMEHFLYNPDNLLENRLLHAEENLVQMFVLFRDGYGNQRAIRRAMRVTLS